LKFGLFFLLPQHRARSRMAAVLCREALDQRGLAGALGFDAVWLAEHDISTYSTEPSLSVFSAAAAQRAAHPYRLDGNHHTTPHPSSSPRSRSPPQTTRHSPGSGDSALPVLDELRRHTGRHGRASMRHLAKEVILAFR
jgi:hypothetical protein